MKGQQVLTRKRILGISIITAIMLIISSIVVYASVIKPKKYDEYIALGNKYLMEQNYEEAILAFDKAIKIDAKTTEARVGQAKAYVGNEENNKAVEVLEEAQNLDKTSEELLKEILGILKEIDPDIAYEFLDRFVEEVGKDNLSQEIKEVLDEANEIPSKPIAYPAPGTYVNPISVELQLDNINIGHTYYYTVDGSTPNRDSNKYSGNIEISETTIVKLIGYNKKDESTDVVTLEYVIDKEIVGEVESEINRAEKLIDSTVIGTEVGNISKNDKKKLTSIVDNAKDLLNQNDKSYKNVSNMKVKVSDGISEFKKNIIKPTDKSKLKSAINEAQSLYNNSTEGSKSGQYKLGSRKKLLSAINSAKQVYNNDSSKQDDIDEKVVALRNSINKFKNAKNKEFTRSMAMQYITDYFYEKPYKNKNGESKEYSVGEKVIINGKEYYTGLIWYGGLRKGYQSPVYIGQDKIVYYSDGLFKGIKGPREREY